MAVEDFYTDFLKESTGQRVNRSTSNKLASQWGATSDMPFRDFFVESVESV